MENKNHHNQYQDKEITEMKEHIVTINDELGSVKTDVAGIKKDIDWLKWQSRLQVATLIAIAWKIFFK